MGQPASGVADKGYSRLNVFPGLVVELMSLRMRTQFVHACLRTVPILAAPTWLSGVQLWSIQGCKKMRRYDAFNTKICPGRMRRNCSRKHRNHRRDEGMGRTAAGDQREDTKTEIQIKMRKLDGPILSANQSSWTSWGSQISFGKFVVRSSTSTNSTSLA